jgi:tRNA 2-thiouridine synthesizing protein A
MNASSSDVPYVLDTRGLFCPEPVMLLHKKIRELGPGETVSVLATDPSTSRDIPKFCHFLGHELLESSEQGKEFHYLIRKAKSSE